MGDSAPDTSAQDAQNAELQAENQRKIKDAELQRIQLLKRTQGGGGGIGTILQGLDGASNSPASRNQQWPWFNGENPFSRNNSPINPFFGGENKKLG